MLGILRSILLSCSAASLLAAQPRPVPGTPDLPPGYRRLADVTDLKGPLAKAITLDLAQVPLKDILRQIATQAGLSYAADPAQRGMEVRRTFKVNATPAHRAIAMLLEGTTFEALVSPSGQLTVTARGTGPDTRTLQTPRVRMSGYVRSAASGEVLRRARVSVDDEAVRGESNDDGFYSLLLTRGTHRVVVRALGYAPFDTTVTLTDDVTRTVLLQRRDVQLAAVTVQASRASEDRPDLDPRTPDMSVVRLDLPAVKLLPPVLGESDPIRSLTLLPGVSLSSDASTAFSVRGGAADQNLFLLDEATVYNPSHVLGFLSTFNADAIDNVTLYKGAIPARFGGRLSPARGERQRVQRLRVDRLAGRPRSGGGAAAEEGRVVHDRGATVVGRPVHRACQRFGRPEHHRVLLRRQRQGERASGGHRGLAALGVSRSRPGCRHRRSGCRLGEPGAHAALEPGPAQQSLFQGHGIVGRLRLPARHSHGNE
jgi:hypothetical protein